MTRSNADCMRHRGESAQCAQLANGNARAPTAPKSSRYDARGNPQYAKACWIVLARWLSTSVHFDPCRHVGRPGFAAAQHETRALRGRHAPCRVPVIKGETQVAETAQAA